jgi:hypothetical protein
MVTYYEDDGGDSLGLLFCDRFHADVFRVQTASAALFYFLYPGFILSLLITGGHGGTKFEEG